MKVLAVIYAPVVVVELALASYFTGWEGALAVIGAQALIAVLAGWVIAGFWLAEKFGWA